MKGILHQLFVAAAVLVVGFAAINPRAHAGDRGLYLHFLAVEPSTPDAFRDAVETRLFQCTEPTLAACRAARVIDSNFNTGLTWLYTPGVDAAPAEMRAAAFRPRGVRALRTWARGLGGDAASLDGVILYRAEANGSATLLLLNFNTGARQTIRVRRTADGTPQIDERLRARIHRTLARGWTP